MWFLRLRCPGLPLGPLHRHPCTPSPCLLGSSSSAPLLFCHDPRLLSMENEAVPALSPLCGHAPAPLRGCSCCNPALGRGWFPFAFPGLISCSINKTQIKPFASCPIGQGQTGGDTGVLCCAQPHRHAMEMGRDMGEPMMLGMADGDRGLRPCAPGGAG